MPLDSKLTEQQILLERAKALSVPVQEAAAESEMVQLVAFLLEGRGYAIDVRWVREILPIPRVTPIPAVPPFIIGAINVRGNIITLTDLELFLGIGKLKDATAYDKILILESAKVQTGILVDEVNDCLSLPRSSIEPPLATIEENKLECLMGQIRLKGKVYALLEGQALLDNPRLIVE